VPDAIDTNVCYVYVRFREVNGDNIRPRFLSYHYRVITDILNKRLYVEQLCRNVYVCIITVSV